MNTTLGIYAEHLFPKTAGRDFEPLAALPNLESVRFGGCRVDNKICEGVASSRPGKTSRS